MIEGALDDDLDNTYEPYYCYVADEEIPASEIIKKFYPKKYREYIEDYCIKNKIIIEHYSNGSVRYFEIPQD